MDNIQDLTKSIWQLAWAQLAQVYEEHIPVHPVVTANVGLQWTKTQVTVQTLKKQLEM